MFESKELTTSLGFNNPTIEIVNLGSHPFADWFIPEKSLNISEPVLPLSLVLDPLSGMIHTKYITDPVHRYNGVDYSYTSSNSETARVHWGEFSYWLKENVPSHLKKVIEVGSNDGYLARQFIKHDFTCLGIDASTTMAKYASEQGIPTRAGVFSSQTAAEISQSEGKFDVLVANNVLNHANDPLDFLLGIKRVLQPNGLFAFEVPYWPDQVDSGNFDMIYHEHVNYYSVKSIRNLLRVIGFNILTAELVNYHGRSLRILAGDSKSYGTGASVSGMELKEIDSGAFLESTYVNYMNRISRKRVKFLSNLYSTMDANPKSELFCVGAAAKGNTFLNYYGLDSTLIKAVTDTSINKIGKFTPLTRIKIVADDILAESDKPLVIILSWNISTAIKHSLSKINPGVRYLE